MIYIAKEGERLDVIVWEHYGDLALFEMILGLNAHIAMEITLREGDSVHLPDIQSNFGIRVVSGVTLW